MTAMETATESRDRDGPHPADRERDVALPWLELRAGETVRWRGGPRPQTTYPWIALAVVAVGTLVGAVALEVVSPLALTGAPLATIPAVWSALRVRTTTYAITSHRVAVRRGILRVRVTTAGLELVQNTAASQPAIGRFVGYGTVVVETAGGGNDHDLAFDHLEDPQRVRRLLERTAARRRDGPRSTVPGTAEQWETVLEEVRRIRMDLGGR